MVDTPAVDARFVSMDTTDIACVEVGGRSAELANLFSFFCVRARRAHDRGDRRWAPATLTRIYPPYDGNHKPSLRIAFQVLPYLAAYPLS